MNVHLVPDPNDRRLYAWLVWGMVAGALLILGIYSVYATNDAARSAESASLSNQRLLRVINGCLHPGGDCHDKASKQRTRTVSNINRATVAASVCAMTLAPEAERLGTDALYEKVRACVRDRLTKDSSSP